MTLSRATLQSPEPCCVTACSTPEPSSIECGRALLITAAEERIAHAPNSHASHRAWRGPLRRSHGVEKGERWFWSAVEVALVLLALLVVVVLGVRQWLIDRGLLFGDEALRSSTVLCAGLLVMVAFWVGSVSVQEAGATVGVFVAVLAALQIVAPTVQDATAKGPCPGAQTRGVEMLAVTHPNGANVRSGPGRSYPQIARFAGDCSVGFVGFCFGDPEPDLFYQSRAQLTVPDVRWLILPHDRGLVHAGVVASQGVEDRLKPRDCPGEAPRPGPPSISGAPQPDGTVSFTVTAPNAPIVGFASYSIVSDRLITSRIVLDANSSDGFTAEWDPSEHASHDGATHGTVGVVAVVCLAGEVPSDQVADVEGPLSTGTSGIERRAPKYQELPVAGGVPGSCAARSVPPTRLHAHALMPWRRKGGWLWSAWVWPGCR